MPTLSVADFTQAFGVADLSAECRRLVEEHDFRYEAATAQEHEHLVQDTVKKLDAGQFSRVGEHRKEVWQKGWGENLEAFVASGYDAAALVPKYYGANPFLRWRQSYIRPLDAGFEVAFYTVLRTWLFRRYLAETQDIYELGCGTGLNLILLAKLFPEKRLYGTDWAPASLEIVDGLARKYGWRLQGRALDFFHPDPALALAPGSAVLTLTALEQVGERHAALLDYLLAQKPALCLHVEPIAELYDERDPLDALALRYHRQRGYLEGFLTALRRLEAAGRIEMLLLQRTYFGGFYNESYSVVAWRPR